MVAARYGMMREVEADLMDRLLDMIKIKFGVIRFLEVGVMSGDTVRGVYRRAKEIDCPIEAAGVDFEQYRPNPTPGENYRFYAGDSMDAWRKIPKDYRTNILFIDACHCVVHSSQDFLNYAPFVENCGYILLHDTALPTGRDKQEEFPQDHSYAEKPSGTLGVREALKKLGLLDAYRTDFRFIEEVESSSGLMGMILYRREQPY